MAALFERNSMAEILQSTQNGLHFEFQQGSKVFNNRAMTGLLATDGGELMKKQTRISKTKTFAMPDNYDQVDWAADVKANSPKAIDDDETEESHAPKKRGRKPKEK